MDAGSSRRNESVKFWVIVCLLLAVHAGLAIDAARRLSVTHDEYWHLPVGLLTWRTGHFDFDNINPPLARLWSALPLFLSGSDPGDWKSAHDAFTYGDAFLAAHPEDYDRQFFLGRIMTVLLSVVTGVWLAIWSRELFGTRGGLLTAALWAFCPNAIANAGLATPDIGLTLTFIATLHAAWKFAQRPTWGRGVWLAIWLGAAQLIKFTGLLLFPLVVLTWIAVRWWRNDAAVERVSSRRAATLCAGVLLLSLVTLNGGYLFRGTGERVDSFHFISRSLSWFNTAPNWVRRLPVPFPRDYLVGLDHQRQIMESQHPVYLDGEWNTTGFREYYLRALAYKTPHGVQLLVLLAALAWLIPAGRHRPFRECIAAVVGIVLLTVVASSSGMQLGLRYILPVYPLLYLLVGFVPVWLANRQSQAAKLPQLALLLAAVSLPLSLRHHPEHLAYFNELSGGPETGEMHLVDSNIDWGQDLSALRDTLKQKGIDQVGLAYFGMVPPSFYGIHYSIPRIPEPGWHAISVNFVRGRPHTIRRPDGTIDHVNIDEFGYFRYFQPKQRIGASIDLYQLTFDDVQRLYAEQRKLK